MEGEEKQNQLQPVLKRNECKKEWFDDWHIVWTVPDGEMLKEKSNTATNFAALVGVNAAFLKCLGPSTSAGLMSKLGVLGATVGPYVVAAYAYVNVINFAAGKRGKSDPLNHALGGAAAGAILGLRLRKPFKIAQRSFVFGFAGLLVSQLATCPAFEEIRNSPQQKRIIYGTGRRYRKVTNLEHD